MSEQIGKKVVTYLKAKDEEVASGTFVIPSAMCLAEIVRETNTRYIVKFLDGNEIHLFGAKEKYINKKDVLFMNINLKGWEVLNSELNRFRKMEEKEPEKREEILDMFTKRLAQIQRGV